MDYDAHYIAWFRFNCSNLGMSLWDWSDEEVIHCIKRDPIWGRTNRKW